ncbi:hypothetical protein [Hwanghaeella sp.]|uniref:hypothetical protein n=1 Tax=Hwanghaeella sp. TaxID=2605943 RepID=UPI003CCC018E
MTTRYPYPSGLLYDNDTYDPFEVSQGDKLQAAARGLLAAGPQLMAAGAPSLTPGGGARGMANFGLAFNQGYQGYLDNAQNQALGKYRVARQQRSDERQDRLIGLREEEAERQAEERAERKAALQGLLADINDPAERAWAIADPAGYLKHRAQPKDPWAGTKVVGGHVLRPGEDGGVETVYSVPDKPPQTPGTLREIQELQKAIDADPNGPYAATYRARLGKLTTHQPVPGAGDDFASALREVEADQIRERQSNALSLNRSVADLNQMEALVNAGVQTGYGEESLGKLKSLANTLGIDVDTTGLAGQEAFRAISNRMVMPLVKQLGQNPTDRDLEFVVNSLPTLGKTIEGNKLIIETMRRNALREAQLADLQYQYGLDNQGLRGWATEEAKFYQNNPLFSPQERQSMSTLVRAASGAGGGVGLPQYQPQGQPAPAPENLPPNVTVQPNGRLRWSPDAGVRKDWQQSPSGNF